MMIIAFTFLTRHLQPTIRNRITNQIPDSILIKTTRGGSSADLTGPTISAELEALKPTISEFSLR